MTESPPEMGWSPGVAAESVVAAPHTAVGVPTRPAFIDWLLVVLLSALSGVIAVFGVFFLPLYVGSFPLPVAAVVVGLTLGLIPPVSYRLTHSMAAAFAPVVVWFVVTVGLYLTPNLLYTGFPVAWRRWQFALLVGLGGLAAAASVGLSWGDHLSRETDARRLADRTRG